MQYNLNTLIDPVVNFGKATVSIGYSNTATTIILNAGEGTKLPDPSIDGSFNLVWYNNTDYADPADDPNVEIVRCISRVTDTLVLMRGQEGTSASNKNVPGKIYKVILSQTKKTVSDIQTDAQSRVDSHSLLSTGVHGVGIDTVDAVGARNTAISIHSSITSSIHNFDALGNAPPQTHGNTKHDSTTVDGGAALSLATQIPLHDSSRHTGTIGTWGQIDKTASNIADIATKSHTLLTDIGTNTHPQIDTHISSYTNIHGIFAGLDAAKPASPAVGQRYIAVDTNKDYECYVAGIWRDITTTHSLLTASVHNFDASGNAPPQLHGLASHTGIIGDHQGNLTGIGTKTHADIDSHIGATASVHNFDTLGNAPPQTHGKTKHDATTVDGGAALSLATQIPLHDSSRHTGTIGTTTQVTEGTNLYYTDSRARTSINSTGPITYNSIAGTVGITQAGSVSNGYLNSTDWNTFNGKQNALGYTPENVANKGAFGGYAPLVGTLVPTANLGSGSPSTSTFLRGDQTWGAPAGGGFSTQTDVTSLRSFNSIYQNTSGKTMMVNSWARSSSPLDLTAQSDATTTPITYVAAQRIGIYSDANSWTTITFLVLNNNYYRINCTGIKGGWIEWT